jgi:UDP:flavonoid glycosyltransferase YjiC (YdhE family)
MPHAAAMVCHGGFGTVRAGIGAGVPMVVLPLFADQPYNGARVAALGAGVVVDAPDAIGGAVARLLDEPGFESAAAAVADDVRGLPTVDAAVDALREAVGAAA